MCSFNSSTPLPWFDANSLKPSKLTSLLLKALETASKDSNSKFNRSPALGINVKHERNFKILMLGVQKSFVG